MDVKLFFNSYYRIHLQILCNERPKKNLLFPNEQQGFSSKTSNNAKMQLLNIKDVGIAKNCIVLVSSADKTDYTYILFFGTIDYFPNVCVSSCILKKTMQFDHYMWFFIYVIFTKWKKKRKEKHLNMKHDTLTALMYSKEGCESRFIKNLNNLENGHLWWCFFRN